MRPLARSVLVAAAFATAACKPVSETTKQELIVIPDIPNGVVCYTVRYEPRAFSCVKVQ